MNGQVVNRNYWIFTHYDWIQSPHLKTYSQQSIFHALPIQPVYELYNNCILSNLLSSSLYELYTVVVIGFLMVYYCTFLLLLVNLLYLSIQVVCTMHYTVDISSAQFGELLQLGRFDFMDTECVAISRSVWSFFFQLIQSAVRTCRVSQQYWLCQANGHEPHFCTSSNHRRNVLKGEKN